MRAFVQALFMFVLCIIPHSALAAGQVTMKDSVDMALLHHPSLKALQEARQAAVFDRSRATSDFLPSLTLNAATGVDQYSDLNTRAHPPAYRTKNHDIFYGRSSYSVTLSQPLFNGFSSVNRTHMADSLLDSAGQRVMDNAEALALDAIMAHLTLERQSKLVALAQSNVANHQNILKTQRDRERSGASALTDVTQTQARLARAESTLVETKLAYDTAELEYNYITGAMPSNLAPVADPEIAFADVQTLQKEALEKNPKILAAKADTAARRYQRDMDRGTFVPRLSLDLNHSYDWQPNANRAHVRNDAMMLRATWTLFNGGYDYYTLKSDGARVRQSNMDMYNLRDSLDKEISATYKSWNAAKEQAAFYDAAVNYNTQTSRMYLDQFNVGQRSLLDILDSENELFNNSMMLITSRMSAISAQYRLLALSGGLLDYLNVDRSILTPAQAEVGWWD